MHLTISRLCDKFEADGRVQDMHRGYSGRSYMSAYGRSAGKVLQAVTQSL
jgi:hypothetical protein